MCSKKASKRWNKMKNDATTREIKKNSKKKKKHNRWRRNLHNYNAKTTFCIFVAIIVNDLTGLSLFKKKMLFRNESNSLCCTFKKMTVKYNWKNGNLIWHIFHMLRKHNAKVGASFQISVLNIGSTI